MDSWTRFRPGEYVINTKANEAATVFAVIPQGTYSLRDLYVLRVYNSYCIVDDDDLAVYDKDYFNHIHER